MTEKTTYEQVQQQKHNVQILEAAYMVVQNAINRYSDHNQQVPQGVYDALESLGQELTAQKTKLTVMETEHMLDTVGTLD